MDGRARIRVAGAALAARPVLLSAAFAALYLATFDSEMGAPDEAARYGLALRIARHGPAALWRTDDLSRYPPLQSLLAAAPARLGLALDGGRDGLWTHRLVLGLSLLACALLVPLFFVCARALDVPRRAALWATALFGLTNPVWPYSKRFYSEPLTAVLALAAFAGVLVYARRGRRGPLVAGLACLALLPLNNMIAPPAVGAGLAALLWLEGRKRALWALGAALGAGAGLLGLSVWVRTGGTMRSDYANEHFTFHVLDGLHGLLLGWGRSVFLFAPLLVLSLLGARALWRRSRGAAAGVGVVFGLSLLTVASWWGWWGGICWGPRLLLPVLPLATLGAAPLLAGAGRWKVPAALLVALGGLYVNGLAVAFKHDYDIFFWMQRYGDDERKAWFEWEYSVLRRMPRHFSEHPWDLSSSFLERVPTGPSVVELGGRPVRQVEIVHRGDALVAWWSLTDLYAVVRAPDGPRREPAAALGASLWTFNGRPGGYALDGDPATRWDTGRKRLDGDRVRLDFGRERADVERLELEHRPHETDFPNALEARAAGDDGRWASVPAKAATPRLVWHAGLFGLLGAALLLAALALRPGGARAPAAPEGAGAADR